jgi:hypothetical protein
MLFNVTDRNGPGHVDSTVEGVGGRSNAVTSFDYTSFYLVVPSEAAATGIELLADMAFRSSFAPEEVAREREVIFEEARIEQDNPRSAIVRQLYGMVFAGHPYGRPVLGTRETMEAATQERLRAFNRRYYVPAAGCAAPWSAPSSRPTWPSAGERPARTTPAATRWTCSPPSWPAPRAPAWPSASAIRSAWSRA